MAANIRTRVVLFLSSYSPLFLILGVRNSFENRELSAIFYGITAFSVLYLYYFLLVSRRLSPYNVKVTQATSRDVEMAGYIVTYLLPFIVVSFNDLANAVSLGIILVVIAILYVQSHMIHINPVLNLLGYHLFEVQMEDGKLSALICRRPYVAAGSILGVISLSDYVIMEKRK